MTIAGSTDLLSIVDEAFSSLSLDKESFYSILESKYGVKRQDIASKVAIFHEALKEACGAKHFALECQIINRLLRRFFEDNKKQMENFRTLAAIGETAAMIGHDLRNPLQTITGEIYLAKGELNRFSDGKEKVNMHECLSTIEEQVGYMDKIISDLQTFIKPMKANKEIINFKTSVLDVLKQVNIPDGIQLKLDIDDSQVVYADPELLKRILINLVTNAVQAMPKGGALLLSASNINLISKITVEDTGTGIPESVKSKIFKPHFTTKSRGQGFGLAICKKAIEAQDGSIYFESYVGIGTKFIIELPIVH